MSSDHWKSEVHRALKVGDDMPGSLTLFLDQQTDHKTYERHLLAERLTYKDGGRHGQVEAFESDNGKPNHYFDATYGAMVAIHHAGWRVIAAPKVARNEAESSSRWSGNSKWGAGRDAAETE
jgi:hypothetical protein